jgi:hypothetical protein
MDEQNDFEENEGNKGDRHVVELLYSALIARQPIDLSYLMINRWCCEATSGSGDIGSGCYLSMLAISLRPGIPRNPSIFYPEPLSDLST